MMKSSKCPQCGQYFRTGFDPVNEACNPPDDQLCDECFQRDFIAAINERAGAQARNVKGEQPCVTHS